MQKKSSHNIADARTLEKLFRLLVAIVGGYGVMTGYVANLGLHLPVVGVHKSEGIMLGVLTGYILYVVIIIWTVATSRPFRTCALIILSALALLGTAHVTMISGPLS